MSLPLDDDRDLLGEVLLRVALDTGRRYSVAEAFAEVDDAS